MSGSGTRTWYVNPGQDGMYWNLPFQTTAQWITSGALINTLRQGSGHVHLPGDFCVPFVVGQSSDPLVTIVDSTGSLANFTLHIPLGTVQEQPVTGSDNALGVIDATKPYALYHLNTATINTGSVQSSGTVITCRPAIDNAAGQLMMDAITGQPGTGNTLGAIQDADLTAANADPNYVIQHMLAYEMDPSQMNSATAIWPLLVIDTSFPNTGGLNQGYTIGIPASVAMPSGLSRGAQLLWHVFQQYGAIFYNVSGNGTLSIDCFVSTAANQALANDIANSISTILPRLCILSNQTGLTSMKGMVNGVRSDAFPAPPILNLTPSGGVETSPASFRAWHPSGYNVTPTAVLTAAQGLTINTPSQQNANAAFAITGAIQGYSVAPTLNYVDDVSTGTFSALPTGSTVTATSFAFTNPGVAAGTHAVTVRDANNTAIVVATGQFTVVSGATVVITPAAPSQPVAGAPFTLSGTLSGYGAAPVLTYADNSGVATALPTGSTVTTSSFTFLHPAMAAGTDFTVISDGTNSGSVTYTVTTGSGGASPNNSVILPGSGSINDNAGNVWTVTSGGQVAVNGVVDTTTAGVVELAWVSSLIWQENSSGLWWSKTSPTAGWLPANGTTTSPLTTLPTVTINAIATPSPNTVFTITGSLANYTAAPTLTYSDNGGAAIALPSGRTVTTTAFSFVHPGMAAGADTVQISDGTNSATASYSVSTAGWTNLTGTPNLSNTVTGLTASTSYDIEVYATNSVGQGPPSAIATVITGVAGAVAPGIPTGLTSTSVAQTSVTLSWTAPATGTTPFTYSTRSSPTGANSWTAGPTVSTTSAQVTGLSGATTYDFEVLASNSAGTSAFSGIYTVATSSVAAATVTWSTTAGAMTLSTNALTATGGGSPTAYASHSAVLSSTSLSSGKASFEVTMSGITQNSTIGFATATFPTGDALGGDALSIGYYMSTGTGSQSAQTIYLNNNPLLTPSGNLPAADTAGAVFTFCVDLTNQLFWVTSPAILAAYGAGSWNDSASANPATGAGGISFAGITGAALSIAATTEEGGAVFTLNAGSSTFTRAASIPSTFPAWNGTAVVAVAPGAVTSLVAGTPSNVSVPLTWAAPSTGSAPLTYNVMVSPHSAGTFTLATTSLTTSATATGLTANTAYDFEVFASNSAGTGGNSNVATATTLTVAVVPGAPAGLSAGTATTTSVPLTWAPPTSGGAPTGYQVQYKLATASTYTNFTPTVPA